MKFHGLMRCLVLMALLCGPAVAHEIRPAVVTVTVEEGRQFSIAIAANLEALIAGIGPEHSDSNDAPSAPVYNQLRTLSAQELEARFRAFMPRWLEQIATEFDGVRVAPRVTAVEVPATGDIKLARISTIRLAGTVPEAARNFRWTYPAEFGSSVLRVKVPGDAEPQTAWLKDGAKSEPISLTGGATRSRVSLFLDYAALGFTHILPKGLDHILFVVGLYLLSTSWRPLLVQVTAFTIAHSITLALGLYGVIQVAPSIVEPLIALSIVYVAVENLLTSKLQPWRPAVVFAFGLLHGLGFAGILQDVGLPRSEFVTGLIAFNIGVELGQLAVIVLAFLATGLFFRDKPYYRRRIVWPASAAIAAVGLFWMFERIMS